MHNFNQIIATGSAYPPREVAVDWTEFAIRCYFFDCTLDIPERGSARYRQPEWGNPMAVGPMAVGLAAATGSLPAFLLSAWEQRNRT